MSLSLARAVSVGEIVANSEITCAMHPCYHQPAGSCWYGEGNGVPCMPGHLPGLAGMPATSLLAMWTQRVLRMPC